MKRALLWAPFVILTGCQLASHWLQGGRLLGNLWAAAFLACLLCVPLISRAKLWLGYVALLAPFVLVGLHLAFDWGSLSIGFG